MKRKVIITFLLTLMLMGFILYSQNKSNSTNSKNGIKEFHYFDSISNLLNTHGWEKFSKEEKLDKIYGYKEFMSKNKQIITFKNNDYPKDGLVNDEMIAIKISEVYLHHIYGDNIYNELPFVAIRINKDVWKVISTISPNQAGGGFEIQINRRDGKILSYVHFK